MRKYWDRFNRADTPAGAGALNASWTQYQLAGTEWWKIFGNMADLYEGTFATQDHLLVGLWGEVATQQNVYVAGEIQGHIHPYSGSGAATDSGLICRAEDEENFYGVRLRGYFPGGAEVYSRLQLFKRVAGVETILQDIAYSDPDYMERIRLDASGSRFTVYETQSFEILSDPRIGDPLLDYTDADPPASCPSGNYFGIYGSIVEGGASLQYARCDDWRAGWSKGERPVYLVVDVPNKTQFPCVNLTPGTGETFAEDDGVLDFSAYPTEDDGDGVLCIDAAP